MTVLVYVLVSVVLVFWVGLPLLRSHSSGASSGDLMLKERTDSSLMALNHLYQNTSRETAADFENIERRLLLDLARLYQQQGIVPGGVAESQVSSCCLRCNTPVTPTYKFCPKCGVLLAYPSVA